MSFEVQWEMRLPVISTTHIPGREAREALLRDYLSAASEDRDFVFVMLDGLDGGEEWTAPVYEWLAAHYLMCWVRFDDDGEVIPDLPTYEWD